MSVNSELTALADAIRDKSGVSGKLSIVGMTEAVSDIRIEAGDIDLEGVNVSSGVLLEGYTAVNATGNKIDGTMPVMPEPTISAGTVTIPKGYNDEELSVTVDEAMDPKQLEDANGVKTNQVAVYAGYQYTTQIIYVGTVFNQDITPGTEDVKIPANSFVKYDLTIPGEPNYKAENIADGVSMWGLVGTHKGGGNVDLAGVTVTAETLLDGFVAIDATGNKVTGNVKTVTPAVNKNVFAVEKGYVSENFTETIAEAVVTETETTATVSPGYVGSELTFNLGSGGGSGTFDLVKVTEYTPHRPEITVTGTVVISGIGTVAEVDRSDANGTYNIVTERDDLSASDFHHTYKHESAEYYLWFEWENRDENYPEENYGYWYIGTKCRSDHFLSYYDDSPDDLWNGTREWENGDYGDVVAVTQNITQETFPEVPLVLKGQKVAGYGTGWYMSDEIIICNNDLSSLSSPVVGGIFVCTTIAGGEYTVLVGRCIDNLSTLTFDDNTIVLLSGDAMEGVSLYAFGGDVTTSREAGYSGVGYNFAGGYIQVDSDTENGFVFGTGGFTWEAYIYPITTLRQCIFAATEETNNLDVAFSYHGERKISVFGTASSGWKIHTMSDELELNKWYHLALVRKDNTLYCFIDGKPTGYTADMTDISVGEEGSRFNIGRWDTDPSDFSARWQGYMDDIRISNIARYQP